MRTLLLAAAAAALPAVALAAGSGDSSPPAPTETTTKCTGGKVFDEKTATCVAPKESRLDDDTLYRAVREFAYAGQYRSALDALAAMSDPQSDRALTYLGFVHRKMGDRETGMAFYARAIDANPDNLLARSYKGQAHVEVGDLVMARAELIEIRTRGGVGSWPETALRKAIESGTGYNY